MSKFYRERDLPAESKFEPAPRPEQQPAKPPAQGSLYKRDEAKFFGEKQEDRPSSKGSVYQRNAAHFFGYETPSSGEHPFESPPVAELKEPAKSKSVLAQRSVFLRDCGIR
ncbi:MAG: hypothetical protein P4M11_16020 [Candidatus Pacebacteria bacterium]|nr:hypothetical protein [Candidatus Paceibacterota bacterium]